PRGNGGLHGRRRSPRPAPRRRAGARHPGARPGPGGRRGGALLGWLGVGPMTAKKRLAILISGRGSNMMALVEAARAPDYPVDIAAIVASRPDAAGLLWARAQGLPATLVDHKAYASREAFDAA